MMPTKPRIAISMGDPGGIGPEVIAKALVHEDVRAATCTVVVGSADVLAVTCERLGISLRGRAIKHSADLDQRDELLIYDTVGGESPYLVGKVSELNGRAAHQWIVTAAKLAMDRKVDAICTAPISKEAIYAAGVTFPGHTELLAYLCGGCDVRMMLAGGGLHVVLQTIHVPVAGVPPLLSTAAIGQSLQIINSWWLRYYHKAPRIAVCGLNPHAGEAGHIGHEEIDIIAPAIAEANASGIAATGPYPADTVFHRALQGDFEVVLAMYHDQALIPVKTLDFHGGVNLTLGLPIIRTSPDHGTAFSIAGKGVANESSMVAAILQAAKLAQSGMAQLDPAALE
ncbi:MAG: 4-hydroxythreonine-4-phosphate dehydrogenase PdxA [Candidatus Sumerlaeaceae bacterium]